VLTHFTIVHSEVKCLLADIREALTHIPWSLWFGKCIAMSTAKRMRNTVWQTETRIQHQQVQSANCQTATQNVSRRQLSPKIRTSNSPEKLPTATCTEIQAQSEIKFLYTHTKPYISYTLKMQTRRTNHGITSIKTKQIKK
jgi:hypothetical protein